MPKLSTRAYSRSQAEQRILNTFPPTSRARQEQYSVAQQIVHPLAAAIDEVDVEVQKSVNQAFPLVFEPSDIDVIYVSNYIDGTSYYGSLGTAGEVTIQTSYRNNLDAFWYDAIPTRLEIQDTGYSYSNIIHSLSGSACYPYLSSDMPGISRSLDLSLLPSNEDTAHWTSANQVFDPSTEISWRGGSSIRFSPNGTTFVSTATGSTSVVQHQLIGVVDINNTTAGNQDLSFKIGYVAEGTAESTVTIDNEWQRHTLFYAPTTTGGTETPFLSLDVADTTYKTFDVANYYLIPYEQYQTTPFPCHSLIDQLPSWAFVNVQGGSDMFDNEQITDNPPRPTNINLHGLTNKWTKEHEQINPVYNGEYRSLKIWKDIHAALITDITPSTAQISVRLNHFRSTSNCPDEGHLLATPHREGPMFYSLSTNADSTSLLSYETFDADGIDEIVGGNDGISEVYKVAMRGTDTNDWPTLVDIEVDSYKRWLWACSTDTVFLYNIELPYASNVSKLKDRSINPNLVIHTPTPEERYMLTGTAYKFRGNWHNREKDLTKYRWMLAHPNGTSYELQEDGSTSALSSTGFWVDNLDAGDNYGRMHPIELTYTPDAYGDYAIYLVAEYIEDNRAIYETDVQIVSVAAKDPIWYTTANPLGANEIYGIDIDPHGYLRLASTDASRTSILDVSRFNVRYDYMMLNQERNIIYYHESYNWVEGRP